MDGAAGATLRHTQLPLPSEDAFSRSPGIMATSSGHLALSARIPSDTASVRALTTTNLASLPRQLPDQVAFQLDITSLLLVRAPSQLLLFPPRLSSHTSQLPLCSPLPTAPSHFPHQSTPFLPSISLPLPITPPSSFPSWALAPAVSYPWPLVPSVAPAPPSPHTATTLWPLTLPLTGTYTVSCLFAQTLTSTFTTLWVFTITISAHPSTLRSLPFCTTRFAVPFHPPHGLRNPSRSLNPISTPSRTSPSRIPSCQVISITPFSPPKSPHPPYSPLPLLHPLGTTSCPSAFL
jgi:hypothetical protein